MMADKLRKKPPTRRDQADDIALKAAGSPSHINASEARLLARTMPESHGKVITSGLLAEAGRRGDDRVTRLTGAEAALLKARGGAGTRNPASGLLEFYGDSPGSAGGGGGEGGDNGVGGPGNGSAGTGPGQGDAGTAGVGGNTSFSDNYGVGWGGVESSIGGVGMGGSTAFSDNYDVGWGMPEDQIGYAREQPNWEDYNFVNYAPKDTWKRAFQEWWDPSLPQPGRFDPPSKYGPGIVGTMLSQLAGKPMSVAMGVGGAMGRASSAATQAASAAEESSRSAHNSGGNQANSHALFDNRDAARAAMRGALPAGSASGAETAELMYRPSGAWSESSPGVNLGGQVYGATVTPSGQMAPTSDGRNTMTGLPTPVENLLADYIWRGRLGSNRWGW